MSEDQSQESVVGEDVQSQEIRDPNVLRCDICGATEKKNGEPFDTPFSIMRHKVKIHNWHPTAGQVTAAPKRRGRRRRGVARGVIGRPRKPRADVPQNGFSFMPVSGGYLMSTQKPVVPNEGATMFFIVPIKIAPTSKGTE